MTLLASYLAEQGITSSEFASKAGLSQSSVSLWMHAKRRPGLDHALAIERATGGAIPAAYWVTVQAENRNGRQKKPKRPKKAERRAQ